MTDYDGLSLKDLASQIDKVISQNDVRKFEQFINQPNIFNHGGVIKILSDILAANVFTREQKITASSSFSLIYQNVLSQTQLIDLRIDKYWDEYFDCMMDRNEDDLIDWPYIHHTINAVRLLVSEKSIKGSIIKEKDFLIRKYNQTTFQGKLMLMLVAHENEDIATQNRFVFIRETIEDFISESLNVIMNVHDLEAVAPDMMELERDTLMIFYEWIVTMNTAKDIESMKDQDIVFVLANKPNIITLIKQQLKCILYEHNGQVSYRKSDKLVELYDRDLINKIDGMFTQRMVKQQLEIKSYAISLLQFFTHSFPTTAELNNFDTYAILNLAQLLTPIFITQLVQNDLLKHEYITKSHPLSPTLKQLTISILTLLKRTSQFNFLLQIYTHNQQNIIYRVFYDYLRTTNHQKQAYAQNPTEFDSYNTNFITMTQGEFSDTAKQACGHFLQCFFQLNNQALVQYMQFLAASLRYKVLGEESDKVSGAINKGYGIPQAQMIYALLARIFYVNDKTNQDLFKFIQSQFLDHNVVFKLTGLAKVRVLILLVYAYPTYFSENRQEGLKFIHWTADTKESSQSEFKIVMELLVVAFDHGIPQKVWDFVNSQIENTNNYHIFKLVKQLIDKDLDSIQARCVLECAKHICARIKRQFIQNPPQHFLKHKGHQYSIFLKCFHIMQQISDCHPLVNQYDIILDEVMDLVDFFNEKQGVERFEFSMEVVVLLNNIIKVQEDVPTQFEKYLSMLSKIANERKELGPLVRTYFLILLKAGNAFENHPKFLGSIKQSLQHRILIPSNWTHQPLVIESLFLLSNILLLYPSLVQQTRQIFLFTQNVFQNQRQNSSLNDKLCATIMIYWMAGEYAFGDYDLAKLADVRIQIFREEFALMFALSLNKLIYKYYNSDSLETLLKLALKLLDHQLYYKKPKNQSDPKFTIPILINQLKIDAFHEIASALHFLKDKLDRNTYARAIDFMTEEYGSSEALSQLLSVRIIDNNKKRTIYNVKK